MGLSDRGRKPPGLDGTTDPYSRRAGSFALWLLESPAELAALRSNSGTKVQRAVVIALRRPKAPELAKFLADPESTVTDEAVRAINDLNIVVVRPQFGALLDSRPGTEPRRHRRKRHPAGCDGREISPTRDFARSEIQSRSIVGAGRGA